jgi:predicted Zn-dependent protease
VQTEIATDLRELGRFYEAETVLRAILRTRPQHFWALVGLGQLLRRRGDRTGSLAQFQAAAAVNPNEIWVQIEIATDLRELDRFEKAEAVLRAILQSRPQHFWALVGLGQLLRRRGDRTGSLAQFQAAAAANPDDVGMQIEIATDLRELGRFDDAEVVLRAALQSNPQHFRAVNVSLGENHRTQNQRRVRGWRSIRRIRRNILQTRRRCWSWCRTLFWWTGCLILGRHSVEVD